MTELPRNPDPADRPAVPDRVERLLTASATHGAPVAADFLTALRERTAAEFRRTHQAQPLTSSRRWQMLFVRAVAAAIATAAVLSALWFTHNPAGGRLTGPEWARPESPALADKAILVAFKNLANKNFEGEIVADGVKQFVAGTEDGKLRFDTEPGVYSIIDQNRAWYVDESANRAATNYVSHYYRRDEGIALNPWQLMGLEPESSKAVDYREQEVAENNAPVLFSYFNARYRGQPVAVETQIDPVQQLPREMLVWPRANRGAQPLARFHLTQAGGAADATKFKVAETLTEDGRIGKIIDLQGLVTVRALANSRWTPLYAPNSILVPGDWLRTDSLGANAVTVQLAPQTKLIVGPGTTVELPKPDQLRIAAGVVHVSASDKTPVTLTGPDGGQVTIRGQEIWRVAQNKLEKVAKEPLWLKGYLGQVTHETLGSLIALVDGRNVPLTVGYHKVLVEIRDQIARTTIEESFVNHTKTQLEGQFYFPLPQDASISGFGMWIDNKLVEADIVEKQRAREIYEAILREKKDPGLLEWTGGNIFKARVFPIFPNSEKRIKITYTQVLPLVGDSYRYSYALQSDLLKQNPLRKLELAVNIQSTQPLQQVVSPTHPTRTPLENSAHKNYFQRLEFSAENFTPTRDFEVVATLATRNKDLTLIPHQRGSDGYFMLLMQPPNQPGQWTRPLVNDGNPMELLILADTSASMDRASRTRQAEVIAALLGSLAPKDKFNLAVCDVDCVWTFEKSVDAVPEQITKAREQLAQRRSMGWTNLQRGWESAIAKASPGAHIVYVGDGLITRGKGDIGNDAQAIGGAARGKDVVGHAIAVSSSYESQILNAIAAVGGGSLRNAAGEVKPTQVAHDLLVEATRPALRNIEVAFNGFETEAVYPKTLANVPAGTQQVVLGRFNPDSRAKKGEVVVRGTLDGKPVSYRADVALPEKPKTASDEDASFIPRLWARQHLDFLLSQGASQKVRDDIVALSEDYHIITPYTSLLILESDAQREQYKVKKRMQMRDGENFFHKSHDHIRYALVQQQLQQAQSWRQQLRQRLLEQLSNLGRDASQLQVQQEEQLIQVLSSSSQLRNMWYDQAESAQLGEMNHWSWNRRINLNMAGGLGGSSGNGLDALEVLALESDFDGKSTMLGRNKLRISAFNDSMLDDELDSAARFDEFVDDYGNGVIAVQKLRKSSWDVKGLASQAFDAEYAETDYIVESKLKAPYRGGPASKGEAYYNLYADMDVDGEELANGRYLLGTDLGFKFAGQAYRARSTVQLIDGVSDYSGRGFGYQGRQPLLPLPLPYHVRKAKPRKVATTWPDEAVAIVKSLQLEDDLRKLAGGLVLDRQVDAFQAKTAALQSRHEQRQLYSPQAWSSRGDRLREEFPLLQWCDERERGNQALAFDLALVRKSDANDLQFLPDLLNDTARWDQLLPNYQVKLERPAANRVLIIAKTTEEVVFGYEERRWLIDTERHVVLESERRYEDKVVDRTVYGKFVQVGGRWLATTSEEFNADGKRTNLATLQIKELTAADFKTAWETEQKLRTPAITFQLPLPKLADAEKSVAAKTAKLEDRLTLLARQYGRRQWTEAEQQLIEAEKLAPGKAGWNWMRLVLLSESRRHEEARQLLQVIADKTISARHPAEYGIVHKVRQVATQLTGGNEQLELLATLQPAYERFATPADGEKDWQELRLESLTSAGRTDDYRDLLLQLSQKYPNDFRLQQQQVNQSRQSGDMAAAFASIEAAIARPNAQWEEYEIDQLRTLYCDILESEGRYTDAVTYCRKWEANSKAFEPNQRLLAYLVLSGQEKQAFDLAEAWLDQHVPVAGETLKGVAYQKVYAAVQLLLGEGRNINRADLNPKYLPRLEKLVLQFAGTEDAHAIAMMIWNHNEFRNSPNVKKVHQAIFQRVIDKVDTLPLDRLQLLFEIALWNVSTKTHLAQLQKIQTELERRWASETKLPRRAQYRQLILRLCDLRTSGEREKALRMFLAGARPEERDGAVRELFDHLLNQTWTAEREAETLRLLDQLASAEEPFSQTLTRVQALYTWTDTMEQRRRDYLISKSDRPDKMKRADLDKKHEQLSRQAREEISQRLATAAAARQNNPLDRWMRLEHLTLEIRLDRNLPQVSDQLWNYLQQALDTKTPATKPDAAKTDEDDEDDINVSQLTLENVWQQRLLKSLLHLAAKAKAPPAQVQRLLKLFEEHQQLQADRLKNPDQAAKMRILNGQQLQYELLLARDMPKELQEALQRFIKLQDETGYWRRQLARVYAELNKLEAGVQLLEELERADLLTSEDCRSLSVWYHALDQKEKHEAAQVKVYRFQQPWRLHSQLSQQLQQWRGAGQLPEKLDPKVLQMFAALLQTEDSPSYYITHTLTPFYDATHDTRLLHSLAKALPGHTPERVYPMLKESWNVLTKVEFEAVIDELIKGLDEVRATAKTDLDRRALDLLEALAHRRAAELQNGALPHVKSALAAIARGEKREWRTGEPQQMAEFLAGLGVISQPLLAAEQLRLLELMVTQVTPGTEAALKIIESLATAHWNYDRHDRAIDLLTAAAQQYQAANGGKVTQSAIGPWFTVVNWQDQRSQYLAAEQTLTRLLPQVANSTLAQQIVHRRYDVYSSALRNNGLTSLGRGEQLYRAALAASRADALEHPDLNFLVGLASRTISIFEAAYAAKIASAADDLIAYSKQDFPEILKRQVNGYDNSVNQMADAMHHVAGPKAAIAFLLQRVESEPVWVKYQGNDAWSRLSEKFARWRSEVPNLGELELPLLSFVIKELKRDLSTQNSHSRYIYHDNYGSSSYFWKEKADAFAAAAEEVLKEHQNSSQAFMYIAEYFYRGLDRRDRALEILLDATRRKILGHDQQVRLVYLLHESKRYAESIPILESLIAQWPLELTRRCELMKAYFQTKQPQALARVQQEIHQLWHQENRWGEGVMQEFGEACLACELFEPAVEYLKEAVAAHTKATNGRSAGDQNLSRQYQALARAYAGLKNTKEAVEAASAAIVCWPRQGSERSQTLAILREVLRGSPDLPAYVKQLDAETKEQDRPIVRKSLGEVFEGQGKFADAIVQYRAAVQLSPNDAELHAKLIECLDTQGDAAGALAQSFDSLELNRRNFELWQKLAGRFDAMKDTIEAERARTSLAEVAPGETEGHTLLAQEREKQNRWEDALEQWQQVDKDRSLEPFGLLGMARVQLHLKQKEAATETIRRLEIKTWPEHTREEYHKKMTELKQQLGQ